MNKYYLCIIAIWMTASALLALNIVTRETIEPYEGCQYLVHHDRIGYGIYTRDDRDSLVATSSTGVATITSRGSGEVPNEWDIVMPLNCKRE